MNGNKEKLFVTVGEALLQDLPAWKIKQSGRSDG
jgi:hypothetical protein